VTVLLLIITAASCKLVSLFFCTDFFLLLSLL
jgi:hypothetical protein